MIKRDCYIKQLIAKKDNGLVKIITGVKRCGKSYLLFTLYKNYLNNIGVDDSHIIQIALDKRIVIVNGNELPHQDENGITYVGVIPFLLNPEFLNI